MTSSSGGGAAAAAEEEEPETRPGSRVASDWDPAGRQQESRAAPQRNERQWPVEGRLLQNNALGAANRSETAGPQTDKRAAGAPRGVRRACPAGSVKAAPLASVLGSFESSRRGLCGDQLVRAGWDLELEAGDCSLGQSSANSAPIQRQSSGNATRGFRGVGREGGPHTKLPGEPLPCGRQVLEAASGLLV